MTDALPQHPVSAALTGADDAWTLTLDRELPSTPGQAWDAVTQPEPMRRWAPFVPSRPLTSSGPVEFTHLEWPDAPGPQPESVTAVRPGEMVAFSWGADTVRLDIQSADDGAHPVFTLTHTLIARDSAPMMAAGWHLCLAALDGYLSGLDVPSVVGHNASLHGWEGLRDQYARLLTP